MLQNQSVARSIPVGIKYLYKVFGKRMSNHRQLPAAQAGKHQLAAREAPVCDLPLDQVTREELWDIMRNLWMVRRPTVLLVTHDLRESAYLANRICVMSARPGRILETRSVPFARPRTLESSYSPEFATLVQQLRMRIADARRGSNV